MPSIKVEVDPLPSEKSVAVEEPTSPEVAAA